MPVQETAKAVAELQDDLRSLIERNAAKTGTLEEISEEIADRMTNSGVPTSTGWVKAFRALSLHVAINSAYARIMALKEIVDDQQARDEIIEKLDADRASRLEERLRGQIAMKELRAMMRK